jgi:diguanylate cyclase (GGDEF)-like protein
VLGRLGGDEFVVVLPGVAGAELQDVAGDIEAHVAQPYSLEAATARIGVSVGVARAAAGAQHLEDRLERADKHMYALKQERRAIPRQATGSTPRTPVAR